MGTKVDAGVVALVLVGALMLFYALGGANGQVSLIPGQVNQQTIGSCANQGVRPVISAAAYWVDPTQNNKKAQVATTMLFAKQDSSQIYNSTTGSATSSTDVSVPCGDKVTVLAGEGGGTTYYYNGAAFDAVGVSHSFDVEVKRSGAATITVHNDTATGWASTILLGNNSITDPDSTIAIRVMPPTSAGAYFGDLGWAMCVKYASLNFTNVYPQPNSGQVSTAHVGGSAAHDAVRCYDMPGTLVAGGAPYVGTLYLDKISSAFQNATIGLDVTLVDKTSGIFNGKVYSGYDTSAAGGDGQATDLGRADVTTSNLLNISALPA